MLRIGAVLLFAFTVSAWTQAQDSFQTRYFANVTATSDAVINLTNAGSNNPAYGSGKTTPQNICANIYVLDPDGTMAACCSCLIRPDGLDSLSAYRDLTSTTLTGTRPASFVVKLLATLPSVLSPNTCSNSAANPGTSATGLRAWATTTHAAGVTGPDPSTTETEFSIAPLSSSERTLLANTCSSIVNNGAGFGICSSCRLGGL
jgi:hypothetical protein